MPPIPVPKSEIIKKALCVVQDPNYILPDNLTRAELQLIQDKVRFLRRNPTQIPSFDQTAQNLERDERSAMNLRIARARDAMSVRAVANARRGTRKRRKRQSKRR